MLLNPAYSAQQRNQCRGGAHQDHWAPWSPRWPTPCACWWTATASSTCRTSPASTATWRMPAPDACAATSPAPPSSPRTPWSSCASTLQQLTQRDVVLESREDPSLLGGVVRAGGQRPLRRQRAHPAGADAPRAQAALASAPAAGGNFPRSTLRGRSCRAPGQPASPVFPAGPGTGILAAVCGLSPRFRGRPAHGAARSSAELPGALPAAVPEEARPSFKRCSTPQVGRWASWTGSCASAGSTRRWHDADGGTASAHLAGPLRGGGLAGAGSGAAAAAVRARWRARRFRARGDGVRARSGATGAAPPAAHPAAGGLRRHAAGRHPAAGGRDGAGGKGAACARARRG